MTCSRNDICQKRRSVLKTLLIMKKNFFLAAGVALVAVAVSISVYVKNGNNVKNDLISANVEALAQTEGGCGFAAYQYDNDWYEDTKNFRRCGDCQWVVGTQPQYTNC